MIAVHLLDTPSDAALSHLRQALDPGIALTTGPTPPQQTRILVAGRPGREVLLACPHLSALLIPFAGLPAVTADLLADFPHIAVHNLHHNAAPTAEMALALLLAVARRLVPADRDFRRHDWTPRYQPTPQVQLRGKRALILGYGAVGQLLGDFLRALGLHVTAIRRTQADPAQGIHLPDQLDALLPSADVLMICLPGTPATEGLMGPGRIASLPQGAILINIGRAAIVDQAALYEALRSGHLFGAGLDVWWHYPTSAEARQHTQPADWPFHELDNVVLSPHRGGGGGNAEVETLRMAGLADSLNHAARGEPLPHRIDLAAGY